MYPVIQVQGDGKLLTTSGASSIRTTMPTDGAGANAKYVRVMVENNTSLSGLQGAHIRTGDSTVVAVDTQGLYLPLGADVILYVAGDDNIAIIRAGGDDMSVYILPVVV